jgi:hypothetical protein
MLKKMHSQVDIVTDFADGLSGQHSNGFDGLEMRSGTGPLDLAIHVPPQHNAMCGTASPQIHNGSLELAQFCPPLIPLPQTDRPLKVYYKKKKGNRQRLMEESQESATRHNIHTKSLQKNQDQCGGTGDTSEISMCVDFFKKITRHISNLLLTPSNDNLSIKWLE